MGCNGRPWQVQSTYLNTEKKRSNKKGKENAVLLLGGVALQQYLNYYQNWMR